MSVDGRRHILAIGGLISGLFAERMAPLLRYAISLTGEPEPRVLILPTANESDLRWVLEGHPRLAELGARPSHLTLFPQPNVADPAALLEAQDLIFVGGGSVANMLAVWRVHELELPLRRAWEKGVVLAGVSAGAICWFESGTTDSFGPRLRPFHQGLGLLRGSYCPHYSLEESRRPTYRGLVAAGVLPAGIACDDGAAAHFVDRELAEICAEAPGATGYRVVADGGGGFSETPLPARWLE